MKPRKEIITSCSSLIAGAIVVLLLADDSMANVVSGNSRYVYDVEAFSPSGLPVYEPEFSFRESTVLDRRRRGVRSSDAPDHTNATHQQPEISAKSGINHGSNVTYSTGTTVPAQGSAGQIHGKWPAASTPIVPMTGVTNTTRNNFELGGTTKMPSKIKVWANQTMWPNVTDLKNHSPEGTHATSVGTSSDGFSEGFIDNKYPDEVTNKTLDQHNITETLNDNHQYYNSTFTTDPEKGRKLWVDLDNNPNSHVNSLLSQSHRRAATIKLKFDFPFYGHKVRNITIATGGFLYTGDYVHSWLAATQYIAPLMANFDTTLSNSSIVKYADNGTAFTVEWRQVHLQDRWTAGPFTFQVTLLSNGDIIFVYGAIPVLVEDIEDDEHPVKVGLSDAYMMDRTVFFARRKTIYEYHRVTFNRADIKNWTAIYLKALPTCLQMENCHDCLTKIKDFDCKWCPELRQCSTGTFRFRQEWLQKHCDVNSVKEDAGCPAKSSSTVYRDHLDARADDHRSEADPEITKILSPSHRAVGSVGGEVDPEKVNMGISGVVGVFLTICSIIGLSGWAAYAYRNPHTTSGQMLIRYRPSQWSWRRGEARYTAATIHM